MSPEAASEANPPHFLDRVPQSLPAGEASRRAAKASAGSPLCARPEPGPGRDPEPCRPRDRAVTGRIIPVCVALGTVAMTTGGKDVMQKGILATSSTRISLTGSAASPSLSSSVYI